MATVRMTKDMRESIMRTAEHISGLTEKLAAYRHTSSPEFDEAMQNAWVHPDMMEKIQAVPPTLFQWFNGSEHSIAGFMSVTKDGDIDAIPVQKWSGAAFQAAIPDTIPILTARPPITSSIANAVCERGFRVVRSSGYGPAYILLCSETQDAYRIFTEKMNASLVVYEELTMLRKTVTAATSFNTLKQCLEFWPALKEFVPAHIMAIHEAPNPRRSRKAAPATPSLSEEAKAKATAIAAKARMDKGV